ncbi:MAG: hypothetical protein E7032_08330 [Akkermansiaceae bacterium]|nr:hypothetical protein [Akkermansiaceae bacterium]
MFSLISCSAMAGVAEWVCCPGELNAPLYRALADCPVVHRWSVADDRSAAFFALGRVQATGRPVVVVAGSGSSAAAMTPAVINAYYQRRPLVVLTMDSTHTSGGTGAPQSVEQEALFGMYAPTVELALPCPVSDLPNLVESLSEGFPLHLHVRLDVEAEPPCPDFSNVEVGDAPPAPRFRGSLVAVSQMLRFRSMEGLVLLIGALNPDEQEPVLWLAQTLRVPVLAEASSGLREELAPYLLHNGDTMLRQNPPRHVLRVGDVPTGAFWKALENLPQTEVYSITRTGFSGLNRKSNVVEGELEQVMKALGDVPHVGDTERLLTRSRRAAGQLEELLLGYPESAEAMVRSFSRHACLTDVICVGSATTVRLWNSYAQCQVPTLYLRDLHSTGADGVLSAFLGNAADAASGCCLIGDLTLLRDINAAAIVPQLPPGKRIVAVLNNEGAAASLHDTAGDPELERLLVQPQPFRMQEIARLWGAEYYAIRNEADFEVLDSLDDSAFVLLELLPEGSLN